MTKKCSLSWCENQARDGGLCYGHLSNKRNHGVPNPPLLALIVGKRTLLAKTCVKCGELKSDYHKASTGQWRSYCRECVNADNRARARIYGPRVYRYRPGHHTVAYHYKYQNETLPGATNHGQEYTSADWDVILRDDLTTKQKAEMLHRTYKAIDNAIQRHRRGEPHD